MKTFLYMLSRTLHLHGMLDSCLYFKNCLRHRKPNLRFQEQHPDFIVPPTQLAFDAYHTVSYEHYHNMGAAQAQYFMDTITPHLPQHSQINMLDWGCGPARIIRHMTSGWEGTAPENVHCYGADYNQKSISWCRENIQNVHFFKNELEPPLPFDDNFFDVVIARSVFTHLSASMHDAWLRELHRILKPGGLLLATLQGRNFLSKMTASEQKAFEEGALVVRDGVTEGKKGFSAFHPAKYVHTHFSPRFTIIQHVENPPCKGLVQDVWLLRA